MDNDSIFERPESTSGSLDVTGGDVNKWECSTEKFGSGSGHLHVVASEAKAPVRGLVVRGQRSEIRLIEPIDSGGMGTVWRAERIGEMATGWSVGRHGLRPVPQVLAVKFVNAKAAARLDAVTVMQRELAPLLSLDGERVVPLVDWSLEKNLPFLAFEFIAHGSLYQMIRDTGGRGLTEDQLLTLALHLLTAVSSAHRCCLLHLDIKPLNILLDGAGGFLLADFGIAMELMERGNQALPGYGTRGFHAPEQAEFQVAMFDLRTDLFGVGMTLYVAATADSFESITEMRRTHLHEPFAMPALEKRRPDLRGDFCALVMSLLRTARRQRPGSAHEVREQVRAMIFNESAKGQCSEDFASRRVPDAMVPGIFARVHSSAWRTLLTDRPHGGTVLHFKNGEPLIEEGAHTYSVFVLLEGALEVTVGPEVVNQITSAGEIVGEVGALTGTDRTATVRAVGDVHVLGFNAAEFEAFVTANPMVATRLLRSLCNRYIHARKKIAQLEGELAAEKARIAGG